MFLDYAATGFSLKAHPMQYIRGTIHQRGVRTAEELSTRYGLAISTRVSVAGIVITRQRPGTAKGVVFLTLEDETRSCNLIIRPALFEKDRATIMMSRVVLATGKLERIGDVIYIDVEKITSLDDVSSRST
jgi:error-prone DNA polymerase